jgi:hypothetical protein
MKKITFISILALVTSLAYANNEIYLEQEGTTGTFNITQIGSSNRIGQSTDISTIKGNDSIFNLSQLGNSNALDINWDGKETTFDLYIEGDGNTQDLVVTGDGNDFDNVILGNNNSLTVSKDPTSDDASSISDQTFNNYIIGDSNSLDFYLDSNVNAVVDITIAGSSNDLTSIQEGGNLGVGHSQTLELQGSGNTVELVQSGSESQTLELTHYGHDTTFTIIQSDGTYTAGLEGANVISNFDGSYSAVYAQPGFLLGSVPEATAGADGN